MTFQIGQAVVHPYIPGIALFHGEDDRSIHLKYGRADIKKISKLIPDHKPMSLQVRPATEEDTAQASLKAFFDTYTHSEQLKTYLQWLRTAGSEGVVNDCGCEKNQFYNYTCECRTLVKLYHRFSIFKDELTKRGYKIEDIEMKNGKHKTVLVSEPAGSERTDCQ